MILTEAGYTNTEIDAMIHAGVTHEAE